MYLKNKEFVHQVGKKTIIILGCTVNKILKKKTLHVRVNTEIRYFSRHSARSTTQNNKTEITYNSTTIELLYY